MRVLIPFLALYRRYTFSIGLGILLVIITLLASIGLLMLSGWFLAASALAGLAALTTFNYMLPAAGVRGSAILRTAARYAERLVSHNTTFKVLSDLRVFTFRKLLPLTPARISQFNRAELLNRLVADVDTLDHLYLRLLSPFISALVVIVLVTCGLSLINMQLALTLGMILLALLFIMPVAFYRAGRMIGRDINQSRSRYRQQLAIWLQSHAELVIFAALPRFRRHLDDIERNWLLRQQQQANLTAISQGLLVLFSGLTFVLILWLAASDLEMGAVIALFVFACLALFESLAPVPNAFLHLGQVISSAERVKQLVEQQPAVTFPSNQSAPTSCAEFELQHVTFTYPNQPQPVLCDINLQVRSGEHVALLGKTGCGKSTLLQLLTRAWDVQSGQITLNQQPLATYSETSLRKMISFVPQRTYLFSATLRQNLLIANDQASDTQLEQVLIQVGLAKLLQESGLNSWLGDGGRQLSGGEQRRLGIARALLHQSPLIIMDEPTEGLDLATEQQILDLINQHCQDKTLIIVTHRLQGLDAFDKIYVMDAGRIIEQGSHAALISQRNHYWRFLQRI